MDGLQYFTSNDPIPASRVALILTRSPDARQRKVATPMPKC